MLILLILNFLIRSGYLKLELLNKVILVVKNAYYRRSVRVARAALLLMLALTFAPTFGGNSALKATYGHVSEALPVPRGVDQMLFYLQRDPDANTVIYQLNTKNGEVVVDNPVHAFWIRYADEGQIKELSSVQRRLAYDLKSRPIGNGKHELRFAAYSKLPLYLRKDGDAYTVTANVQQKELVLSRIFVRLKEGTLYFPKVEYIELIGKDADTGRALSHRINI